jgi:hypothetical protein
VVRQDYNYSEYFVRDLLLANEGLTPTPTATLTATVTSSTPTPAAPGEPPVQPAATEPALLPSLTPFPTPSPVATAADVILPAAGGGGRPDAGDSGERSGLFQRLQALEYGRLGTAFWQGARLAFLPFALLALYLLVRGLFRRLWRALWGRWQDGRRHDRVR